MAAGDVSVQIVSVNAVPCAKFDGVDDRIFAPLQNIPNCPSTQIPTSMTLACWAKPESQADQTFLNYCNTGTRQMGIGYDAGQTFRSTMTGATGSSRVSTDSEWHSVVCSYDASTNTCTLFIDGLSPTGTSAPNQSSLTGTLAMGVRSGTSSPYKGMLRDVCLYNVALTQAEAAVHALGGNPSRGLIARWPLDGNSNEQFTGTASSDSGVLFIKESDNVQDAVTSAYTSNGSWFIANPAMTDVVITHIQEF